jgi:hypothetical protein
MWSGVIFAFITPSDRLCFFIDAPAERLQKQVGQCLDQFR